MAADHARICQGVPPQIGGQYSNVVSPGTLIYQWLLVVETLLQELQELLN